MEKKPKVKKEVKPFTGDLEYSDSIKAKQPAEAEAEEKKEE
jgi:hypothetical protein